MNAPGLGLVLVVALSVPGCGPGEQTRTDQPPAEVGGCFTIAGLPIGGCGKERGHAWANRRVVEKASQGGQDQYQVFAGATSRFQQQHPGVTTAGLAAELTTYRAKLETLDTLAASMGKA